MLRRLPAVAALALAALVCLAPPAWAHVELDPTEAVAGSTETLTFAFHHGKDGAATTGLVVQLSEGATLVDVPLVEGFVSTVDDAERTVTWSGGSVPDGTEGEFPIVVELPSTPGVVLFPTIQQTEAGDLTWISEEDGEGEGATPAPRLTLVADPNATATTSEATTTTTDSDLPGTTLEAEQRDDGRTSAAPWVIGSGIAALLAIGIGGTILKRRAD